MSGESKSEVTNLTKKMEDINEDIRRLARNKKARWLILRLTCSSRRTYPRRGRCAKPATAEP